METAFRITVLTWTCFYKVYSLNEMSQLGKLEDSTHDQGLTLAPPKLGWVDPFDMLKDPPSQNLYVQSDVDNYVLSNRLKSCESHLRRFVNMFLRVVRPTKTSEGNPAIHKSSTNKLIKLEFFLSDEDLVFLQDFGENGDSSDRNKFETVFNIFGKIYSTNSKYEQYSYSFHTAWVWFKKIFSKLLTSPESIIVCSLLILAFSSVCLVQTHSFYLAVLTFSLTVFLCGFGFTWIRMYEEKEVEKYANIMMHGNVPKHCTGNPLPWYELIYFRIFGVDCIEFYKIRDVRPIVKISPTDVFTETISSLIVNPSSNMGKAYGLFITSLTDSFPLWLQPFAGTVAFIIPLILALVILPFLFRYHISLSLTGFHIAPTWRNSSEPVQCQHKKKYIEDMCKKENCNLQNGNEDDLIIDKNPLFVAMNWIGFQKLMSKGNLPDQNILNDQGLTLSEETQKEVEEKIETLNNKEIEGSKGSHNKVTKRKIKILSNDEDMVSSTSAENFEPVRDMEDQTSENGQENDCSTSHLHEKHT